MEPRAPLVSINIPCYHQLAQARRCVDTVLAQSLGDFELTLFDDGASDEYRDYVQALGDPRVRYHRNPSRLGAMRNMFQAIAAGSGTYTLAFHEDDLLGRHFLATAVGVLETHPTCGFVAAELREFTEEPSDAQLAAVPGDRAVRPVRVAGRFRAGDPRRRRADVRIGGLPPRRRSPACRSSTTPTGRWSIGRSCSRSWSRWSGAVLRDPLVWYRHHPDGARHQGMHADHILRLFTLYRSFLPRPLSAADEALFYRHSGYWLFTLYDLTPDDQRPSFGRFLFRVWAAGLYQARWRGRFGLQAG